MDSFNHFHLVRQAWDLFRPVLGQRAYLDPGSGSFLLQLLIATLLGGLFLLKTYWTKVKVFFTQLFSRGKVNQADDEDE